MFADLVDLHDVGMLQARDSFSLGLEACQVGLSGVTARQYHLQRHQPIELAVPGLIHHAHAAAAQFAEDLVARHGGAAGDSSGQRPADLRLPVGRHCWWRERVCVARDGRWNGGRVCIDRRGREGCSFGG